MEIDLDRNERTEIVRIQLSGIRNRPNDRSRRRGSRDGGSIESKAADKPSWTTRVRDFLAAVWYMSLASLSSAASVEWPRRYADGSWSKHGDFYTCDLVLDRDCVDIGDRSIIGRIVLLQFLLSERQHDAGRLL